MIISFKCFYTNYLKIIKNIVILKLKYWKFSSVWKKFNLLLSFSKFLHYKRNNVILINEEN